MLNISTSVLLSLIKFAVLLQAGLPKALIRYGCKDLGLEKNFYVQVISSEDNLKRLSLVHFYVLIIQFCIFLSLIPIIWVVRSGFSAVTITEHEHLIFVRSELNAQEQLNTLWKISGVISGKGIACSSLA
ncbi:hypothetical protein AcW1_006174 [Taiwanofungus camphoratus]|nr:hypothetical protein AcW1_006174 [Antrodia cinnamomea]